MNMKNMMVSFMRMPGEPETSVNAVYSQPHYEQRYPEVYAQEIRHQQAHALGDGDEVGADADQHEPPGHGLQRPRVEALAEELGDGKHLRPPEVAPEEQHAQHVSRRVERG